MAEWVRDYQAKVKQAIQEEMQRTGHPLIKGPVHATWIEFRGIPQKFTREDMVKVRAGKKLPIETPDLDNCEKVIMDGVKKDFMEDDNQVVDLHAQKRFGRWARLELQLASLRVSQVQAEEFGQPTGYVWPPLAEDLE